MKLTMLPFDHDDLIRVQCEGQLSLIGHAPTVDPLVQILGPRGFSRKVLMDLHQARGADTSGIAWLSRTTDRFHQNGGRFVMFAVPPIVEQIVTVLGLAQHFVATLTESEARIVALNGRDADRRPAQVAEVAPATN